MATYTAKVLGICKGGEHYTISVMRDGKEIEQRVISKTELFQTDDDWEQVMVNLLRQSVRSISAKTADQIKNAITSVSWVV